MVKLNKLKKLLISLKFENWQCKDIEEIDDDLLDRYLNKSESRLQLIEWIINEFYGKDEVNLNRIFAK